MICRHCGEALEDRVLRVRRGLAFGACGLGLVLAYTFAGSLLRDFLEGLQRSRLPMWKAWLCVVVLGAGVLALRVRQRHRVCTRCGKGLSNGLFEPVEETDAERRTLLRILATAGVTAVVGVAGLLAAVLRNRGWVPVVRDFFFTQVEKTAPVPKPEWTGSQVASYRRLGRTNVMVSDISLGSASIRNVEVARLALDRGINYFDTAPDYADAESERILGEAMRGRRDQVFLATKFCLPEGHLPNDTPVPKVIEAVEGSLRRLQTDYVDLIHIHACDRVDRLMAPNIHEAFDRLKQQGKARFLGVSSHTPNLERVAHAAIDSGRFDVMMLAYHFGMWRDFDSILAKANAHGVGVVAMKTLKGARHTNLAAFRDEASSYSQAAFRWVLSNPNVSCLVVSFSTLQQVDEYLYASGGAPGPGDVALLRRYDELIAGDYCQPHCGACLASCPHGLPINDVLRYRMYFRDYGREREGMRLYGRLERNAALCVACGAPCAGVCPGGVPIRERMLEANARLSARA
jgi:uncharacterized protein